MVGKKKKEGVLVELDPTKWHWFIVKRSSPLAEPGLLEEMELRNGNILIINDLSDISIVEGAENIKDIYIQRKKGFEKKDLTGSGR